MTELLPVKYTGDKPTVSGRELHEALGGEERYSRWFERYCEYGFTEGEDYTPYVTVHPQNQQNLIDHDMSIPMAKEIAMIQRNEKGKTVRQYLIAVEDAWNTPEMVMSRALKLADAHINSLRADNARLTADNAIMLPKAEYFDELVDRNLLTSFRDTAKELKIKEREFVDFLLKHKYVYRDRKGKLMPYADKNKDLFEVKECVNEKSGWSGTQALITPKGRETFRLLTVGLKAG